MEVVFKELAGEVAEVVRHRIFSLVGFPAEFLQRGLDLRCAALFLVCADQLIALLKELVVTLVELDRKLLVELCDLLTEVSGAGVDDKIFRAVLGFIDLDEVVASA